MSAKLPAVRSVSEDIARDSVGPVTFGRFALREANLISAMVTWVGTGDIIPLTFCSR